MMIAPGSAVVKRSGTEDNKSLMPAAFFPSTIIEVRVIYAVGMISSYIDSSKLFCAW